jgi:glutaredoxin
MSEVTIYTKEGCPYCAAAKKHYTEQGVAFEEIDVNKTPGATEKAVELRIGDGRRRSLSIEHGRLCFSVVN